MKKPTILNCLGCFWPGHDASGPNQSFLAFSKAFENEFNFKTISRDPDGKAPRGWQSYKGIQLNQMRPRRFGAKGLYRTLNDTPHDLLLLNGFHDREFTIPILMMRRFGLIPKTPLILSPRGEFAKGALSLKANLKDGYRKFALALELTKDVWFHATSEHEKADIEAANIPYRGIFVAPNLRTISDGQPLPQERQGPLRLVFVGRITPVKNLHYALSVLSRISIPLSFDIIGPPDDQAYWTECKTQSNALPQNISVTWTGALPHEEIMRRLPKYDLFFLPTLGENFGHAIHEAFAAGLPALIANTTPWRNLQKYGAGWDISLDCKDDFAAAIERMHKQSPPERIAMRRAGRRLAEQFFADNNGIEANRGMLHSVLNVA